MNDGTCTLEAAVGRANDCPGHRCPFWVSEDGVGCVVDGADGRIASTPGLADYLLELRLMLARARQASEDEASAGAIRA